MDYVLVHNLNVNIANESVVEIVVPAITIPDVLSDQLESGAVTGYSRCPGPQ